MHVVITTPTGNIGRRLAENLSEKGADLTLLARNPDRVKDLVDRGAAVEQGSLDDADFVIKATSGADALFWLTPAPMDAADFRASQTTFGRAAAAAIKSNSIPRVVNLSSMGAHKNSGHGPINGLHDVERLIDDAAENVTHLRPTFFFENYLMQLDAIKGQNGVFVPVRGNVRLDMVATRDIADAAAARLLDTSWTGHHVLGLHGPEELSFDEAAQAISRALGRQINHVAIPPEAARDFMLQAGMAENTADTMLEMYASWDQGTFESAEPRTAETTTPTTLEAWAGEVLRPMVEQQTPVS
jgi:uncharacterized protein YbjT (DUF2867 family)